MVSSQMLAWDWCKVKSPAAIYSKSNSVEKIMDIIFQEILPFKLFSLHKGYYWMTSMNLAKYLFLVCIGLGCQIHMYVNWEIHEVNFWLKYRSTYLLELMNIMCQGTQFLVHTTLGWDLTSKSQVMTSISNTAVHWAY